MRLHITINIIKCTASTVSKFTVFELPPHTVMTHSTFLQVLDEQHFQGDDDLVKTIARILSVSQHFMGRRKVEQAFLNCLIRICSFI